MTLTTFELATGEHYTRKIECIEKAENDSELVYSYIDKNGILKRSVVNKAVITSINVDYQ